MRPFILIIFCAAFVGAAGHLYELDALNAPTTTALFAQKFHTQ